MLDPAWHTKINNNFEKVFNAPMPFLQLNGAPPSGPNFTPVLNASNITEGPDYTFTSSSSGSGAYVYSTEVFSGSLYVSFTINAFMANVRLSAGFGGTPDALGNSWTNDMVLYMTTDTTWDFYKLGTNVASGSGINDGDFIEFVYSGTDWEVFVNGGSIYSTTVTAGQDCYFSSSLSKVGAVISDVKVYPEVPGPVTNFTPVLNASTITEGPDYTFTATAPGSLSDLQSVESYTGSAYLRLTRTSVSDGGIDGGVAAFSDVYNSTNFDDNVFHLWFNLNQVNVWVDTVNVFNLYDVGADGGTFEILYSGTTVEFKRNGVSIYSGTVTSGQTLYLNGFMFLTGDEIRDVFVGAAEPPVSEDISFEDDARLFKDCVGVYSGILYVSDGSAWIPISTEVLENIVALDTGTATLQEIQDAYNALLADLQVKGWMA